MRKLSQKEWIGLSSALVVIAIFFLSGSFIFSFFSAPFTSTEQNVPIQADNKPTMNTIDTSAMQNSGGVAYQDLTIGTGEPVADGKTITLNYIGTLQDGTKFDSSYDAGQPLVFAIGKGQLIPGFEKGIAGMKVGGKRRIVIPPELGYGPNPVGPIPANSVLVFDIDLVDVK